MKANPELVKQIRERAKEGIPTKEIAKELGISATTVYYWINDEFRDKAKQRSNEISTRLYKEGKSWAARNPERYKAWFREYQNDRYNNDPDYRVKIKKANRERMAKIRKGEAFKSL